MRSLALASVLLAASFAAATAGSGRMFTSFSTSLGAQHESFSVGLGDLNADGLDDLVVGMNAGIAVSLSTGGGEFGPFTASLVNHGPLYVRLGDFDGDGLVDLATWGVITGGVPGVIVAHSNGLGGWADSVEMAAPGSGSAGVVGDLNGDGRADLVYASDSNVVSVYLGNANRTLTLAGSWPTSAPGTAIAIGDITGSTAPDVVVTDGDSARVSVFVGNGDGTLGARTEQALSAGYFATLAPVDASPGLDLVFGLAGQSVAGGLGSGVFNSPVSLPSPTFGGGVVVRDLNHDGRLDVVSTGYLTYPRVLNTWLGDGAGGFLPRMDSGGSEAPPIDIAAGDVDGDGNVDIAWAFSTVPSVFVSMGRGDGRFGTYPTPPAINGTLTALTAGDFDADGKVDVASAIGTATYFSRGHGDGTFDPFVSAIPGGANWLASGRFDPDGIPDLVAINTSSPATLRVLHGNGDGTFSLAATHTLGDAPKKPTLVDLDADGRLDVVVPCTDVNSLHVLMQGPSGLLAPVASTTRTGPQAVRYADLNGDGRLDRAVACANLMSIEFGDGAGGYSLQPAYPVSPTPVDLTLGDLDEDGALDVALVAGAPFPAVPPRAWVLKGHPDGSFDSGAFVDLNFRPETDPSELTPTLLEVESRDFDGDGHLDLFCRSAPWPVAAHGRGDRTFDRAQGHSVPFSVRGSAFADVDGDGFVDFVTGGGRSSSQSPSTIGVIVNRAGHLVGVPPMRPGKGSIALAISGLAPNPGHGAFQLSLVSGGEGQGRIELYTPTGRRVFEQAGTPIRVGSNLIALDLRRLPSGIYWVRATLGNANTSRKLVVF